MNSYKFKLRLNIHTKTEDPDEISKTLALVPTRQWRKGELRTTPTGRPLEGLRSDSYCSFLIREIGEGDITSALEEVCLNFQGHAPLFRRIQQNGGQCHLLIAWFVERNSGEVLGYGLLGKLASLGVDLAFDVYPGAPDSKSE